MVEMKRASACGAVREDISRIFVEGFFQWLQFFSKDKEKLSAAFSHMFQLDVFYVALVDGRAAGIAACTDGHTPCVRLDGRELRRHLGWYRGTLASLMLRREFENHAYPFAITPGMGSVEFVAVSKDHRGQGIAFAMLRHIHETEPYREYVLEVADTNTPAVQLYQKLGYEEFCRVAEKHAKQSGINALVYMKCARPQSE